MKRDYCHVHGKHNCSTCFDECLAEGIRNDQKKIMELNARIAGLEQLIFAAASKTCAWSYDEDDDAWSGSCGVAWVLNCGDLQDNDISYCPKCGGEVTEG